MAARSRPNAGGSTRRGLPFVTPPLRGEDGMDDLTSTLSGVLSGAQSCVEAGGRASRTHVDGAEGSLPTKT